MSPKTTSVSGVEGRGGVCRKALAVIESLGRSPEILRGGSTGGGVGMREIAGEDCRDCRRIVSWLSRALNLLSDNR